MQLGQHAVLTLPSEGLREGRDDAIPVLIRHTRTRRQAEALVEEAFADFAAMHFGASEDGLKMHGLPDGAGLDILSFERVADLLAGDARDLGIDGEASKPAGRLSPGGFRLHSYSGQRFERIAIGLKMSAAARDFAGKASKLTEPDTGGDITKAIVIANGGMLIMRSGIPGLGREEACLLGELGIIGDKHATTASGDDFVAVEGMDAG